MEYAASLAVRKVHRSVQQIGIHIFISFWGKGLGKAVETAISLLFSRLLVPWGATKTLRIHTKDLSDMPKYAAADRQLRIEGGGNLFRAAIATGLRRYLQQSSGFFLKAVGGTLADELSPLDVHASPGVAASAKTYEQLEQRVFSSSAIEGVALRDGFLYGPKTWYYPGAAAANAVLQRQSPVVGKGEGISSFVHVDDAAAATVAALTADPGVYNLVDDDPSPQAVWLPAFARFAGAPAPPHISEEQAIEIAGAHFGLPVTPS